MKKRVPYFRSLAWAMAVSTLGPAVSHAQDLFEPMLGAYQFRTGVHPTVDVVFDQGDMRDIVRFWRDELKGISIKVKGGREMTGMTARIPSVSNDTLRVLVQVERGRGALYTTTHVAFFTVNGYISPESPAADVRAAKAWVAQRSVALRRQLAQTEVDKGERELFNLKRQLDGLKRDRQRAEHQIKRAEQRIEDADRQIRQGEEALARLEQHPRAPEEMPNGIPDEETPVPPVQHQSAEPVPTAIDTVPSQEGPVQPIDSLFTGDVQPDSVLPLDTDTLAGQGADDGPRPLATEGTKRTEPDLMPVGTGDDDVESIAGDEVATEVVAESPSVLSGKERMTERRRWEDRVARATRTKEAMEKRIKDLEWSLTRNQQDQATKQEAIVTQEGVVEELKRKLQSIR